MTELVILVLRLGLAAVFGSAGAMKLFDRSGTRETLVSFGVRDRLARIGAVLLPLTEMAIAGALLALSSARWGALAALVLLLVFIGGLANALARGRSPACHCFGQLHSKPASWKTVGRNIVLALVAAGVATRSHGHDVGIPELAATTATAAGVVVLALLRAADKWLPESLRGRMQTSPLLTGLARAASRVGVLGRRGMGGLQGLPVGDPAPDFRLHNVDSELVTLASLQHRARPTVLIFSDPGCRPCIELRPEITRWQRANSGRLTIAVITTQPYDRLAGGRHSPADVLIQQDREVASAYAVRDMPSAVVVAPDGSIGSPLAVGPQAIAALVDRIAAEQSIR